MYSRFGDDINPYGADRNRFESQDDFRERREADYEAHCGEEARRMEYERSVRTDRCRDD